MTFHLRPQWIFVCQAVRSRHFFPGVVASTSCPDHQALENGLFFVGGTQDTLVIVLPNEALMITFYTWVASHRTQKRRKLVMMDVPRGIPSILEGLRLNRHREAL